MENGASRFVGTIPDYYDRGLGPVIFVDYADEMARRAAAFSPKRVLETAAGTGIVTRRLRDSLPSGSTLTATDLNPPMIEVARAKFTAGENVTFHPADAMALPFADSSFDMVVSQFGVMFFPDKDQAYREVHRVLVPGGRYLFSIWDTHKHNPYARIVHTTVGEFFPDNRPQFMTVPFSYHFDAIKDSMIEAGFSDIVASVVRLDKEIADAAAFARGIILGNPLSEEIRTRGGDPDQIVDALIEAFGREFGTNPGRMPLQAIMFSGTRPA